MHGRWSLVAGRKGWERWDHKGWGATIDFWNWQLWRILCNLTWTIWIFFYQSRIVWHCLSMISSIETQRKKNYCYSYTSYFRWDGVHILFNKSLFLERIRNSEVFFCLCCELLTVCLLPFIELPSWLFYWAYKHGPMRILFGPASKFNHVELDMIKLRQPKC